MKGIKGIVLLMAIALVAATVAPAIAEEYKQDGTVYSPSPSAGPKIATAVTSSQSQIEPGACGPIDLAIMLDDTGSMGGAITSIVNELPSIVNTANVASGGDLSIGFITFRDTVEVKEPLTPQSAGGVTTFQNLIAAEFASGGGDAAEPSDEAKNTAINNLLSGPRADVEGFVGSQIGDFNVPWRPEAVKLAVLITDAPSNGFSEIGGGSVPFGDSTYVAHMANLGTDAASKGIKVYDVFVPTAGDYAGQQESMQTDALNSGGTLTVTAQNGDGTGQAINTIVGTCGKVSGVKFDDTNGNGAKDTGEPGLDGWTITLTNPNKPAQTTTTASDGSYSFRHLEDGQYTVSETLKPGWIQTAPGLSETGSATYTVDILNSNVVTDRDFGNFKLGSISGEKYNDVNGNGIKDPEDTGLKDWTITLTKPDGTTLTTTTDPSGNYNFGGLTAGTYTVSETMPAGWIQTAPAVSETGSATHTVTISTSGQNEINKDFGNFKLGTVSGMKFQDLNANGKLDKDLGEGGLQGWQINIQGTDTITGKQVSESTTTDVNGNYQFLGLTAGTYTITETPQDGWVETVPSQNSISVTITSGSDVANQNFGNFHKGKITGGGWISIPKGDTKATFGLVGQYPDSSNTAQGNVEYQDHVANLNVKSTEIDSVATTTDGKIGVITGIAQVNGAGSFPFTVYVEDNGEPGKGVDVFEISLPTYPYSSGAPLVLSSGNIQIHS